jgi:hypothetical protein
MIERLLKSKLEPVARRERQLRLWRSLAVCWAATALTGLLFLWLSSRFGISRNAGLAAVVLTFVAGLITTFILLARRRTDYREVARKIEREHPDLHALLITAVEQRPDAQTGEYNFLQNRVIREAIAEVQKRKLITQPPSTGLTLAHAAHLCALAVALAIVGKLATLPNNISFGMMADSTQVKVEPGDVAVEKGTPLFVLARFSGPVPGLATLVFADGDGETRRLPLQRTLSDPVFGGSIPEVSAGFKYHVEFSGSRSRDFNITVFEYPRLERADAEIRYPDYTGLAQKRVEDTRRVTAVEGSQVDVQLQLNKPVRSARLIAKDKSAISLVTDTNKSVATLPGHKLEASQSLALELVDADGRTNKVPAQFVFDVLKNKPPDLKLAAPRGDQRVSPLEEMAFAAEAADDFGLRSVGLTYTMAGQEPATIKLDAQTARHEKRQFGHLVRLEDLRAVPDQLLSWFVWAEDVGPDGQLRRTESDMYFAEVRPLDEIFREGSGADASSSAEAGMQMGGQTLKLAELQKQIINATWKLQRQFPANASSKPPPAYKKDAEVVRDSQQTALEQAEAMKERVDDPRFKGLWERVEQKMQTALEQLKAASDSSAKLPPALNAEQEAYQALLSLSAREYQVSRGQRGGGGGGGGERNQRQLDNLELKQDKDRYETQRQAAPQQKPEQREQLAVLSRLKELAQRQRDLNERLKDLQTALREAKTEQERKELERELKRLRDEERELLADMDEVQQTMEKSDNQAQMAESRQQLEETRSHVQNAAEALEKGSVSQALSAGTRAQRDLQQLRDDFRKKNSNQFAEDMREIRREARELAQTQEEISSKIENETNQKQKTLAASEELKQLGSTFQEQKTGLTNLLQQMRQVSEQAEPSEPMLSRQLYESLRKTSQGNVEQNLSVSEELLKRSFLSEAAQFSRRTQEEMNELKRGVEEAASGVLGDEAETLRFAKSELDDLVNKLGREIDQFAGGGTSRNQDGSTNGVPRSGQGQGEPRPARPISASPEGQQNAQAEQQQGGSREGQSQGERNGQESAQARTGQQENQAGERGQNGESQGQGQEGQQPGNQPGGQQQGEGQGERGGGDGDRRDRDGRGGRFDPSRWTQNQRGGADGGSDGGPLTGGEFREWSERLGQVEELLDQPDLRGEVARIRDRARAMRAEFKRHSKEPKWDLVRGQLFQPLTELRNRVAEELARAQSTDSLVPIDRDPVPNKFSDLVRRYYEKLGEGSPPPAAAPH